MQREGEVRVRTHAMRGTVVMAILLTCPCLANAQQWTWAVRATAGVATPTGTGTSLNPADTIALGTGPVLTVDVIRALDCNLEFVASGVVNLRTPVNLGTNPKSRAGTIAPGGVQLGLAFKPCQRSWGEIYVGPLVGAFERDRTAPMKVGDTTQSVTVPGGWGIGALAGVRKTLSDRWALDGGVRWQRYRALLPDGGHIAVHPLIVTGGAIVRF